MLTIYCQTEKRALCANCVYGVTKHRTHKLIPLKDAIPYINEDNVQLWKLMEDDIKSMDLSMRNCLDNTNSLQKEFKSQLKYI